LRIIAAGDGVHPDRTEQVVLAQQEGSFASQFEGANQGARHRAAPLQRQIVAR
jgi:hypothetical protein